MDREYFKGNKQWNDYYEIVSVLETKSFDEFIKYAKKRPDNFLIKRAHPDFLEIYKFLGDAFARQIASSIAMYCYLSLNKTTLDFYYAELRKYAGR